MRRALAALALLVTPTACGSDAKDESADLPGGVTEADVDLATDVVQHHAQAMVLVDLVREHGEDTRFVGEALLVGDRVAPQIEQWVDLLEKWDQPVPETARDHSNAHADEEGEAYAVPDLPGLASAEELDSLETASDFDAAWTEAMIAHDRGALDLLAADGLSGDTLKLADATSGTIEDELATLE